MGDPYFWLHAVSALFCLGMLALVAVVHQNRRRLALQTNQPPERGWIWIYLILLCWVGLFVSDALSDLIDSLWTLSLALMVVFGTSSVLVLYLLFFVVKPWEGNMRRRPASGAHGDDQAQ